MESAKAQLQGKDYSRMLLYLTLPESGDETYAFLSRYRSGNGAALLPRWKCLCGGQFLHGIRF